MKLPDAIEHMKQITFGVYKSIWISIKVKYQSVAGPGLARTLIDLSSYKGGLCGLTVGRRDWEFFSEGFLLPKVMINALLVVLVVPL